MVQKLPFPFSQIPLPTKKRLRGTARVPASHPSLQIRGPRSPPPAWMNAGRKRPEALRDGAGRAGAPPASRGGAGAVPGRGGPVPFGPYSPTELRPGAARPPWSFTSWSTACGCCPWRAAGCGCTPTRCSNCSSCRSAAGTAPPPHPFLLLLLSVPPHRVVSRQV